MLHRFTAIIFRGEKFYVAKCAELGVVSQGESIEEARSNLREAVELYLEDEEIPVSREEPIVSFIDAQYA